MRATPSSYAALRFNHAEYRWPDQKKPRVLIFIVAYNAERTISAVLRRVPASLSEQYEIEVLIIDDASSDSTFERSHEAIRSGDPPFPVHILFNPVNEGYGGNQKLGYHYAIEPDQLLRSIAR